MDELLQALRDVMSLRRKVVAIAAGLVIVTTATTVVAIGRRAPSSEATRPGALALTSAAEAIAHNARLGVFPPDQTAYGSTYGQWAARWSQWMLTTPASVHPLRSSSADCS